MWLTVEADVREAHRTEAAVTVVRDNGDRDAATAPAAGSEWKMCGKVSQRNVP